MESVSSPEKEKKRELTPKAFTKLLAKLSADPEVAGVEYEELRRRLIKFFEWRGALFPRERAGERLKRSARKKYVGEETEKKRIPLALGGADLLFFARTKRPDK